MAVAKDMGNVVDGGDSLEGVLPVIFLIRSLAIGATVIGMIISTPHFICNVSSALLLENLSLGHRTHIYILFEKGAVHPMGLLLDRHRKLAR